MQARIEVVSRSSAQDLVGLSADEAHGVWFARHTVFTTPDFQAHCLDRGLSRRTADASLRYHVARGTLVHLGRGLYAVTRGEVNFWLIPSLLAADAIVAYGGALSFHGVTGLGHQIPFVTRTQPRRLVFSEVIYQPIRVQRAPDATLIPGPGQRPLCVSTLEDALVDVVHRQELGPPFPEVVALIRTLPSLDVGRMVARARSLRLASLNARLGYLLEGRGGRRELVAPLFDLLPRQALPLCTTPDPEARPEPFEVNHRWRVQVPWSLLLRNTPRR